MGDKQKSKFEWNPEWDVVRQLLIVVGIVSTIKFLGENVRKN